MKQNLPWAFLYNVLGIPLAAGALYLDTCIEPWPGGYTDTSLSPSHRSNYALRERAIAPRAK